MVDTDLDRTTLVQNLESGLRPLPHVDAFWEGGAPAWGRVDAWSDIDLYVVTEEPKVPEVLGVIEEVLAGLSPVQQMYAVTWPSSSGITQRFYRLRDASPFLLVDLAVLARDAPEKFLEPEIHGENVVYFDKTGVTDVPPLNEEAFESARRERLRKLKERTEMFHISVERDLARGHGIEALDAYRAYVLNPLIEALRMKQGPLHHAFGRKYIYDELTSDTVGKLERLVFVKDPSDLGERYQEALQWFREVVADLDTQ